jgi:hypothetical protein
MAENTNSSEIPGEFLKITKDFFTDMLSTFPEYTTHLNPVLNDINADNCDSDNVVQLFKYCKKLYPERFFDLLYQNAEIFTKEDIDTHFIPGINFDEVWAQDITEKTRMIIWKYLQLVCFAVINNQSDVDSFGETASLFEAINEDELKSKLSETMEQMAGIFDMSGNTFADFKKNEDASGINQEDLPNPEDLHKHISGLLDGKLGRLAAEITEETMKDFQDIEGVENINDVFKVLFKDPGRLIKMIKKVGGNLDAKIKSGEIKESELMEEASELMEKLKGMPGMKNMHKMMAEMGLPMGGKNSKVNMGAFQGQMKRNIGKAKTKERLQRKLAEKRAAAAARHGGAASTLTQAQQIELLQKQLAEARANNSQSKPKRKKKRRRKNKGKK